MSAPGDVVFHRGENDEEDVDIWDDTALIKAYDNAVSIMKDELTVRDGGDPSPTSKQENKPRKKNKGKRRNKNKDKYDAAPQWRTGDHCQAAFTEDGSVYEAVIVSTDTSAGTCWVRYLGYGNEEEQQLKDLLPPGSHGDSDGFSETESIGHGSRHGSTHRQHSPFPPTSKRTGGAPQGWPDFPLPPMGNMPQQFPMMPPMMPGWMPSGPGVPSSPRLPPFPPPPPMLDEDAVTDDKEAMYSMLMSWYMSGYHTGYYQGLKQGKKQAAGSKDQSRHKNSSENR